jgi:hypothetical protein
MKTNAKNVNETLDSNQMVNVTQFNVQSQPTQFIMRPNNPNYRFEQNFVQQPPPMTQNSQFSGPRALMSNSNMNMFQQNHLQNLQQPPPPVTTTTATHQFIQQDVNVYQQNNTAFHANNQQQQQMNRFNAPQQPTMSGEGSGMMTGNYQQQPRFRQW